MELPQIGEMITTERGLALCGHFKLDYLVERITANREEYDRWKFDGCSCLPDEILGFSTAADGKISPTNAVCPTTSVMPMAIRETILNESGWI